MSKVIRVGLIGAGAIAKAHIDGYRTVDDVEIVAVWNRTKTRALKIWPPWARTCARASRPLSNSLPH
jgi:predicted dehydrogenase